MYYRPEKAICGGDILFFKRKNKKKDADSEKILEKINGRSIKYASARDEDGVECIICKDGRIIVTESEIAIRCSEGDDFCVARDGAAVGELMSLEGVRIEGEKDGLRRCVTAFYTYYRK